jgi:hypothetical protein
MLDHKFDASPDQFYAWSGQVTWMPTEHEGSFQNAAGTQEMSIVPCDQDFRPVRKQNELPRLEGILDSLKLANFVCVFCLSGGSLASQWPEGEEPCPRCGETTLEPVGSYLT